MSGKYDFEQKLIQRVKHLNQHHNYKKTRGFTQHGETSVFVHCICVAYLSCVIAKKLHIKADKNAMIDGALLHDYFLYDWHDGKLKRKIHGFTHPFTAAKNAERDFGLGKIETNIIKRHMFPLVPIPPATKEAWIVCIADKICALEETVKGKNGGRKMKVAEALFNKLNEK